MTGRLGPAVQAVFHRPDARLAKHPKRASGCTALPTRPWLFSGTDKARVGHSPFLYARLAHVWHGESRVGSLARDQAWGWRLLVPRITGRGCVAVLDWFGPSAGYQSENGFPPGLEAPRGLEVFPGLGGFVCNSGLGVPSGLGGTLGP